MKKIKKTYLFFSLLCLALICNFNSIFFLATNHGFAFANQTYYGRATKSGLYLYSTPYILDNTSNLLLEIQESYFVKITKEENELFYSAEYNGIYGYVLKKDFVYTDKTPTTPYPTNITFRVFTPSGADLRSSPYQTYGSNNLVTTINYLDTNLTYYGAINGEEMIRYKGSLWYYCSYHTQNQTYYGYVYSQLCDLLSNITYNNEVHTYVEVNLVPKEIQKEQTGNYLSIDNLGQIVPIILLSLPCLAIVYFLLKPTKISLLKSKRTKAKQKEKPKISKLKHSDFYELDSEYFK